MSETAGGGSARIDAIVSRRSRGRRERPEKVEVAEPESARRGFGAARIRIGIFSVLACLLGLALIEGLVSLGIFFYDLSTASSGVARLAHSRYDETLGWENIPGAKVRDLYGPGLDVTINEHGFRGPEIEDTVPAGKCRIVVSGDSFTFGYGVGDEQTWARQLMEIDDRLEVVNMGQGGYGIDQAYLWYRRDGEPLDHDVHVFAAILLDFARMREDSFLGYGKPVLRLDNGEPVADGVPVAEPPFFWSWLVRNQKALRGLRMAELGFRALDPQPAEPAMSAKEVANLAFHAMVTLDRVNRAHGRPFVFLLLPTRGDHRVNDLEPIRQAFPAALRAHGVLVADLIERFRGVPADEVDSLFIAPGELDYIGAEGHYTAAGNRYVAEQVYRVFMEIPSVAACVEKAGGDRSKP